MALYPRRQYSQYIPVYFQLWYHINLLLNALEISTGRIRIEISHIYVHVCDVVHDHMNSSSARTQYTVLPAYLDLSRVYFDYLLRFHIRALDTVY
jgi:hypothetical protein